MLLLVLNRLKINWFIIRNELPYILTCANIMVSEFKLLLMLALLLFFRSFIRYPVCGDPSTLIWLIHYHEMVGNFCRLLEYYLKMTLFLFDSKSILHSEASKLRDTLKSSIGLSCKNILSIKSIYDMIFFSSARKQRLHEFLQRSKF